MHQVLKSLLRLTDSKQILVGYRGQSKVDSGIIYAPYIPVGFLDPLNQIVSGCTREHNGGKELNTLD